MKPTLPTKVEASSHAEVIRRALQLYEAVIEEAERGGEVSIRCEGGDLFVVLRFIQRDTRLDGYDARREMFAHASMTDRGLRTFDR